MLDVAYTTVDSPVGKLLLAATPKGLVRVAHVREDHDRVLAELAVRLSPRVLHAPKRLDDAARELDDPTAIRAVGSACATNPLPVVVPCHRVLRTDGTLGGYIGESGARFLRSLDDRVDFVRGPRGVPGVC